LEQVVDFLQTERKATPPTPADIEEALQQRTEDEVNAEIEMEAEDKTDEICSEPNCYAPRFVVSRYCPSHYDKRLSRLTREEREIHDAKLNDVLNTLTYREREILKLRWGLGDGYVYTPSECGRIFKVTPQRIGQIEAKALRKLQHPIRRRGLDAILP
jgi:RNA polymerase sigma factor (sigma-70 family)